MGPAEKKKEKTIHKKNSDARINKRLVIRRKDREIYDVQKFPENYQIGRLLNTIEIPVRNTHKHISLLRTQV